MNKYLTGAEKINLKSWLTRLIMLDLVHISFCVSLWDITTECHSEGKKIISKDCGECISKCPLYYLWKSFLKVLKILIGLAANLLVGTTAQTLRYAWENILIWCYCVTWILKLIYSCYQNYSHNECQIGLGDKGLHVFLNYLFTTILCFILVTRKLAYSFFSLITFQVYSFLLLSFVINFWQEVFKFQWREICKC